MHLIGVFAKRTHEVIPMEKCLIQNPKSEEIAKKISSMPLNYQKNIQFGTVDAFQGKEFDIVFLSTVRSNKHSDIKKRIGFLSSPNRLCVAFSRAKKMLIAVGDIETVGNDGENIYEFRRKIKNRSR